MRILLYILIVLSSNHLVTAQHYFNKTFELEGGSYITPLIDTVDNGYLMISSEYNEEINRSLKLQRLDSLGNIEWYSQLDSADYKLNLIAHGFIKTSDENYMVFYSSASTDQNDDIRLVKISGDGEIIWKQTVGDFANEFMHQIIETSDNGFLLVGGRQIVNPLGYAHNYVMKLDSTGLLEWSEIYPITGGNSRSYSVLEVDSGYVIGGRGIGTEDDVDMYWYKIDKEGELLWQKSFVSPIVDDCGASIYGYTDSTYLLTGCIDQYIWRKPFVAELDRNFDMIWHQSYDIEGTEQEYIGNYVAPVIKENREFLAVARHKLLGNIGQPLIVYFDNEGEIKWTKKVSIDTASSVLFETVKPTGDGGYVFSGYRSAGGQIGWILKTDSLGNTCSFIGCDSVFVEEPVGLQSDFVENRLKVAPNPAKDYLLLTHEFPPTYGALTFQLINVQGTIIREEKIKESLVFYRIDLQNIPSGIYIYKVLNASRQEVYQTGKIIVE